MRAFVGLFLATLKVECAGLGADCRGTTMRLGLVLVLGLAWLLAACAVRHASPDGITIEHDAYQPELAAVEAREHCAQYGKKAELVGTSPAAPSASLMYLESSISMYNCVPE
jgi:hypothetical protein